MATNNDLLSDIADTDRNTKTNNQLLQMIADGGGSGGGQVNSIVAGDNITVDDSDPVNPIVSATGGGGGGLQSPLSGETTFDLAGNPLLFDSQDNNGTFAIKTYGVGGSDWSKVDVTDDAVVLRAGGTAGGEGDEYKANLSITGTSISFGLLGSGQFNIGGGYFYLSGGLISADAYPNTRDDSSVSHPINFLYTDSSGNLLSAPLVSSGTTVERPAEGVTGQQYFDTTLGLPIWLSATPGSWVDATGTAV